MRGNQVGEVPVMSNGSWWTRVTPDLVHGEKVEIFARDDAGNESERVIAIAKDIKPPELLEVNAVEAGSKEINGTSEPLSIVMIILPNGEKVEVQADDQGNWSASSNVTLNHNETIKVSAKDNVNNQSPTIKVIVKDTQAPEVPVVNAIEAGSKEINGTSEPNSTVVITLPNDKIVETQADNQGMWHVNLDTPLNYNEKVFVYAKDIANNESLKTNQIVSEVKVPVNSVEVEKHESDTQPLVTTDTENEGIALLPTSDENTAEEQEDELVIEINDNQSSEAAESTGSEETNVEQPAEVPEVLPPATEETTPQAENAVVETPAMNEMENTESATEATEAEVAEPAVNEETNVEQPAEVPEVLPPATEETTPQAENAVVETPAMNEMENTESATEATEAETAEPAVNEKASAEQPLVLPSVTETKDNSRNTELKKPTRNLRVLLSESQNNHKTKVVNNSKKTKIVKTSENHPKSADKVKPKTSEVDIISEPNLSIVKEETKNRQIDTRNVSVPNSETVKDMFNANNLSNTTKAVSFDKVSTVSANKKSPQKHEIDSETKIKSKTYSDSQEDKQKVGNQIKKTDNKQLKEKDNSMKRWLLVTVLGIVFTGFAFIKKPK